MFSFCAKLLDRLIIRGACAAQPKCGTYSAHLAEAAELLSRPDLFNRPVIVPTDVKWSSDVDFRFPSAITSPWPENNIVYAKLQRAAHEWTTRPTVVLVHGWNDEIGYAWRHPYQARHLLRRGINVAMLELPYHMKRRPRTHGAVKDFLSEDLHCTILAAQQAVSDIRALIGWLRAQGCARTGLLGVSLGGWLTGLVTCHEENVSFAAMNVPVCRMDRVVNELPFCKPIRHSLGQANGMELEFEKLNLRAHHPKPSRDQILIVEAVDDLFASKEAIEELWETWSRPEIWRVNHAHISGLFSPSLLQRQVQWLAEKAVARTERALA